MDFYNYTYLYANGYLDKFRAYFNNPELTYSGLTAILKTLYKKIGYKVYKNDKGEECVYLKRDLDYILGNPYFFRRIFNSIFHEWNKNKIKKEWEKEPRPEYHSPEEDMNWIRDNYGLDESVNEYGGEPRYTHMLWINYKIVPETEEDDELYFISSFEDENGGYFSNFNEECSYDDLCYYFGNEIADMIVNGEGEQKGEYTYLDCIGENQVDNTDVNSVNDGLKKKYGATYCFSVCGYLLTDGTLLDFSGGNPYQARGIDHHINFNGLGLYDLLALGEIRMHPESPGFEFCQTPTQQQIAVLKKFISGMGWKKGYMFVDKVDVNGNQIWGKEYNKNEFEEIIPDILSKMPVVSLRDRGKSQFADFLQEHKNIYITESQFMRIKDSMKKNIYLTESQLNYIKDKINEEKYFVDPDKVKIVKKFLDDNFVKGGLSQIGEDGYPTTIPIVALKGTDGVPVRNMTDKQLYAMLLDKFKSIYSNKEQVKKFLKQMVKKWYYDNISKEGLLDINEY